MSKYFKKFHLPVIAMATCLTHAPLATAEIMELADKNGTNLSAQVTNCDETNVTIIRESDKKTFTIPLTRLDEASQKRLTIWKARGGNLSEIFEISVQTGKNRRTTSREDFDDKRVNLDPVVTVRNPDPRRKTKAAQATILFLGRPVTESRAIFVFKKSVFDLVEIPPLGTETLEIGKISAAYDTRGYAKFGARYIGYVMVIHDDDGEKVYHSSSVPTSLVGDRGLSYLPLKTNMAYDQDFRPLE